MHNDEIEIEMNLYELWNCRVFFCSFGFSVCFNSIVRQFCHGHFSQLAHFQAMEPREFTFNRIKWPREKSCAVLKIVLCQFRLNDKNTD